MKHILEDVASAVLIALTVASFTFTVAVMTGAL